MDFDLNLMRVFLMVMDEGSVTRAAQRLNLTQPAVSYALNRLREQFDDPLFVRTPNGMQPTPVARALAEPIERGLNSFAEVISMRQAFDPQQSKRRFRMAMSDIGVMVFLPELMEQLHTQAPKLQLEIREVALEALPQALRDGEIDLAIGNLEGLRQHTCHAHLFHEHYCCMGRQGHPLLTAGKLTRAQYRKLDHILVDSRGSAHRALDGILAEAGVPRRPALTLPHFSAAAEIARRTDLVITLPYRAALWLNRDQAFDILPVPIALPPLQVTVHWHRRFDADPGTIWLRERVVGLLGEAE